MPDDISLTPAQPRPLLRPARFRTGRALAALFIREMSTTYGRNAMGYAWAVLEPVAGIALLSLVFSLAFRAPSLGTNFPLFYASGLLPFLAYLDISQKVALSLRFSRQLLYYPGVTYTDALGARFLLNAVTQLLVAMILLSGIILAFDLAVILDIPHLALGFALATWLALGVGTLNCYLLSSYPAWERTWAILNRPLFIVSCVFFVFDDVPQPYQGWLWFNPLIHCIGLLRAGIYATYDAGYVSLGYVIACGGVPLALGLLFLRRHHRDIIERG
ncbi:ABC transporter permease [Vannielia litorea]|uniref:Capsular polysaccharide transport system permease protein n=1 Tax=Vannielia litorea TaxID=1217970 RepID=A0A1N6HMZ2_9RHOB|nr:ABC transporter permease [Vannielia litorea]SIO21106.1 capsular polysaccharide transport system permease protein [Vannielia litorea]